MKPQISIIIPVYNTANYLAKCLDSVCNQTLREIEIICIDDASTDDSLAILREYASRDERIKIIAFPENRGAASARNAGIKSATGEYIGFIDSDDFIDLDFYEKLYDAAVKYNADCAKGNYKDAQTGAVDYSLNKMIAEDKNVFSYAYCSAVFKRAVIEKHQICFPNLVDMEDPVFTLRFAVHCNKISIVDDACVHIVSRLDSVTRRKFSEKQIADKISGFNQLVEIANEANISETAYVKMMAFWIVKMVHSFLKDSQLADVERALWGQVASSLHHMTNISAVLKQLSENYNYECLATALERNAFDCMMNYSAEADRRMTLIKKMRCHAKTTMG